MNHEDQQLSAEEAAALEPRCVVTRLRFRTRRQYWGGLLRFYQLRTIAKNMSDGPAMTGVLRDSRQRQLVFVSLWPSEYELLKFTTLEEHVNVSRWTFHTGAQVWSGLFHFQGTSSRSEQWLGSNRRWTPGITDWSLFREIAASASPLRRRADKHDDPAS